MSPARERLVHGLRLLIILLMPIKLDIYWLVIGHVHEVDRRAARLDDGEVCSVLRVVKAVERTVFDAESVVPEM